MKKTIEQVEQEIEAVLVENDKTMRPPRCLSAPHARVDFGRTSLELPDPRPNAYNVSLLYRGPSMYTWMRTNPGGNYRRWLRSTYLRKTDLYRRGWKRIDIEIGLGEPDRYCRSQNGGIAHLYHYAHVAAAEATEWFITRPCVVAPRLYIEGLSLNRIAQLLNQPVSRIYSWTDAIRRAVREGRIIRDKI